MRELPCTFTAHISSSISSSFRFFFCSLGISGGTKHRQWKHTAKESEQFLLRLVFYRISFGRPKIVSATDSDVQRRPRWWLTFCLTMRFWVVCFVERYMCFVFCWLRRSVWMVGSKTTNINAFVYLFWMAPKPIKIHIISACVCALFHIFDAVRIGRSAFWWVCIVIYAAYNGFIMLLRLESMDKFSHFIMRGLFGWACFTYFARFSFYCWIDISCGFQTEMIWFWWS